MTDEAWEFDDAEYRLAKNRLLDAIRDVDEAMLGPRDPTEHLTNYVVVVAHRRIGDTPNDDGDQVTRITMDGQAVWQSLGLMEAELCHLRTQMMYGDGEEDDE